MKIAKVFAIDEKHEIVVRIDRNNSLFVETMIRGRFMRDMMDFKSYEMACKFLTLFSTTDAKRYFDNFYNSI